MPAFATMILKSLRDFRSLWPSSFIFIRQALQLHANVHLKDRKLPKLRTFAEKYLRMLPDMTRQTDWAGTTDARLGLAAIALYQPDSSSNARSVDCPGKNFLPCTLTPFAGFSNIFRHLHRSGKGRFGD